MIQGEQRRGRREAGKCPSHPFSFLVLLLLSPLAYKDKDKEDTTRPSRIRSQGQSQDCGRGLL